MSDPATENGNQEQNAPELNDAEKASIETAKRGFSEPTNVNERPPEGPQRPEHVPEQFWKDGKIDAEGLAKSYAELRSKMDGKPAEKAPEEKSEEADPATDAAGKIKPEKKDEEGADDGEPSPLQTAMDAARSEWAETQEVSEDTVEALEAAGIPRDVFSLYLEGLKAQTTVLVNQIHEIAGGQETYEAATAWAAKNLKSDEIEAFNAALDDPKLRETAITGLIARHQKAVPSEGRQLTPNDSPAAGSDVFESKDDLIAAQKDPRYQTDAKYRQEVAEKLARSQRGGFQAFDRPRFGRQILQ